MNPRSLLRSSFFSSSFLRPLSFSFSCPFLSRGFSSSAHTNTPNNDRPWTLVYGGNGTLGQSIISEFNNAGWSTISVDYHENVSAALNVLLEPKLNWKQNSMAILNRICEEFSIRESDLASPSRDRHGFRLSAVVHSAGGWRGGDLASSDLFDTVESMMTINVQSAVAACKLGGSLLRDSGLLVLTGASAAAAGGTPSMIGYGLSKAATHHLVLSLAQPDAGLPNNTTVSCVLPITIDTPNNRHWMPNANFGDWTPPALIAETIVAWAKQTGAAQTIAGGKFAGPSTRIPKAVNGGFYEFRTKDGQTKIIRIDAPLGKGN